MYHNLQRCKQQITYKTIILIKAKNAVSWISPFALLTDDVLLYKLMD